MGILIELASPVCSCCGGCHRGDGADTEAGEGSAGKISRQNNSSSSKIVIFSLKKISFCQEREFNRRSEVLKRGLPRPLGSVLSKAHWRDQIVDSATTPFLSGQGEHPAYSLSEASKLVNAEMLSLILRDEFKFPNDRRGKNVTRVQEIELEEYPDEYIGNAKSAISAELDTMLTGPQGRNFYTMNYRLLSLRCPNLSRRANEIHAGEFFLSLGGGLQRRGFPSV